MDVLLWAAAVQMVRLFAGVQDVLLLFAGVSADRQTGKENSS